MEDLTKLGELLPRFITEILIAIVCGGLIGLERGLRQRTASLRDNVLICTGVTLFMIIAELCTLKVEPSGINTIALMASGVVIGSALLGAGMIVKSDGDIPGITSASAIWVVTGIGLIIGTGNSLLAMLITGIILITLMFLHLAEKSLKKRPRPMMLKLTLREDTSEVRQKLQSILENHGVKPDTFRSEKASNGIRMTIQAVSEPEDVRLLTADLWSVQGVTEVEH